MRRRRAAFWSIAKLYGRSPLAGVPVRRDCWWAQWPGCGGIAKPGTDHSASRCHPAVDGYRGLLTGDGAIDGSVGFRSPALAAESLPRPPYPPGGRATTGWLASGCSVHPPQTCTPVHFWLSLIHISEPTRLGM